MKANQSNNLQKAMDFMARGDGKKVVDTCRKLLKKSPKDYDVLHLLGIGYRLQGQFDKALKAYLLALKVRPEGSASLFCNLAFAHLEIWGASVFRAKKYATKARLLAPSLPEAYEVSADVALRVGDTFAAEKYIQQGLEIKPNDARLIRKLARVYRRAGRLDQAMAWIQKGITIAPDSAEVLRELGDIHEIMGETDAALVAYDTVARLAPEMEEDILARTIALLSTHGRAAELEARALGQLTKDPGHLPSHLALLRAGVFPGGIDEGLKALRKIGSGKASKVTEEYAIASALDKAKRYDESFSHYSLANKIKTERDLPYSLEHTRRSFKRIKSVFDGPVEDLMRPSDNPESYPTPVFILGLPRSGTSLTEQLLGSHSAIFPAGELQYLLSLVKFGMFEYPAGRRQTEPEHWDWVRDTYLQSIRELSGNAAFVIDKMPDNFQLVGFLRELFPNAIIIHTFRDPISNCLSLFKANFLGNHPYAQDLEMLGEYYGEYQSLMDFWIERYGDDINPSRYEDLVRDMRPAVERLLGLCDLEWEDEIENFHSADRIVRTASNDQVRQPIYQSSVKGWKKYEKHLGPLITSLKTAGVITDADLE